MTTANPYAAPKAVVTDAPVATSADYLPGGRSVGTRRGLAWLREAWKLYRQQPGLWIGMMLLLFVILFATALLPFLGAVLQVLFWPVLAAGVALGCEALHRGEELEIRHLFAGFQTRVGTLISIGALSLAATLAIILFVFMIVGVGAFSTANVMAQDARALLPWLVFMALVLPVAMAIWFAPELVAFHGEGALAAMKGSFSGCLKNVLPFLLYGFVLFLGMIAFGVVAVAIFAFAFGAMTGNSPGTFLTGIAFMFIYSLAVGALLGPLVFGSIYTAYRDIYLRPRS